MGLTVFGGGLAIGGIVRMAVKNEMAGQKDTRKMLLPNQCLRCSEFAS